MKIGKCENRKSLALLLDPEKADLTALPLSADCCPDYIFVGGSTGGDTTPFVRASKTVLQRTNVSGLTAKRSYSKAVLQAKPVMGVRPLSSSPATPHSLRPKRTLSFTSLCFPETTPNTLLLSRFALHGVFLTHRSR